MKNIIIIFFLFFSNSFSQELDATVNVRLQNIPESNRDALINFENSVKDYLNNTKFTGSPWSYQRIKCNFVINISSAIDEVTYIAQVFIVSQRNQIYSGKPSQLLNIMDNNWNFLYEKNQSFFFYPDQFNSLTSFLDYYALLIIGMDNDSWESLSGTPQFNRASNIVNLGINTRFSNGWQRTSGNFNRRDLIEDLLNEKYRPVREGFFVYHLGLDIFPKNKQKGQENILAFIKRLEEVRSKIDLRSIYIKTLFDAKSQEIVEYMRDYPDKSFVRTLKAIDPPHSAKYDELLR